jgi:hypothetical protein
VAAALVVMIFEWVLDVVLGATLSLALLLGSSPLTGRGCTGCPDAVRFLSVVDELRAELRVMASCGSAT